MSDGAGRIYKRGNVWWIDYHHRGERYRESSGSHRKKDAKALLKKRLAECGKHGAPMTDEEDVTFADLRKTVETDYKVKGKASLDRVQRAFDRLEEYFGGWRAVDIKPNNVKSYVGDRQDDGAANATINKELAALRRAFNLMVKEGTLSKSPHVLTLDTDNVRERFLTMADVEAVCAEIGPDLAPVVRFAALTGWRKSEILGLQWRQVNFDSETVHLDPGTTKNKEGRTFPFSTYPPLRDLLLRQRERTDRVERRKGEIVRPVFHRDGNPIKSMRGAWNGACKRAGLQGSWFHDLRRTAVRNLERAGVPRSVATKLTGHKTESVYRRYAIADEAALKEGVGKLADLHANESGSEDRGVNTLSRLEG